MDLVIIAEKYSLMMFELPFMFLKGFLTTLINTNGSVLLSVSTIFFLFTLISSRDMALKLRNSLLKSLHKVYIKDTIKLIKLETFGNKVHQVIGNYLLFLIYPLVLTVMTAILSLFALPVLVGLELSIRTRASGLLLKYVTEEPKQLDMVLDVVAEEKKDT